MRKNKNQRSDSFLDIPITELQVSEYFKTKCAEFEFLTLRQITDIGWGKLLKSDGFCYDWFNELVRLLKFEGLLDYLESKQ